MAKMARDNIEVDELFKLKPRAPDLFYPALFTYEDACEGETGRQKMKHGMESKGTREGDQTSKTNARRSREKVH